jgi:CHASE3 domain sensor protein
MLSQDEKDRIDYQIEAQRKARDADRMEWVKAALLVVVAIIFISILASAC